MPFATFRLWGKIFWITLSLLRKIVVVGRAIVPVWSVRPILCFNDWTLLSMISSNWYITKVVIDLITVWKPSCLIYRKLSVWIQTLSVLAPIQYFHSLVRFNIHIAVSWFRLYLISWLQSTFHSITNNFDLCWIEVLQMFYTAHLHSWVQSLQLEHLAANSTCRSREYFVSISASPTRKTFLYLRNWDFLTKNDSVKIER